jgi:hypothetical protein
MLSFSDLVGKIKATLVLTKDVESLVNTGLQYLMPRTAMQACIAFSKICTKRYAYFVYMGVVCSVHPLLGGQTIMLFYLSRQVVMVLKHVVRQGRPYNEYPTSILYFHKRKHTYSFPSQSVVSLGIVRLAVGRCMTLAAVAAPPPFWFAWTDAYFTVVLVAVALTRIYRGLHYVHDMLCSALLARVLFGVVVVGG